MPTQYVAKQGDHVSSIAAAFGLPRNKIWSDPNNAALKAQRVNRNVLYPGDQVFIPDLEPSEYPRSTDLPHKFQVDRQTPQSQSAESIRGLPLLLVR